MHSRIDFGNFKEIEGKSVRKRKTLLDDISNLSEQLLKISTFSEKAKTCGSLSELNIYIFDESISLML